MSGALLPNLLLFGRVLHGLGLDVNPGRMIDLVRALEHISIAERSDFYHAARALLVHRRDDLPRFDAAFEEFWRRHAGGLARPHARVKIPPTVVEIELDPTAEESDTGRPATQRTYSNRELLGRKDFADMTDAELEAVKTMMASLVWRVRERRTRRMRRGHGPRLDLRRTVRRNLRYGGELLDWAELEPKYKPRPLVILADVSGSMERYARMLLLFTYGLAKALEQRVEAFVFSTRLTRITRQLRDRNLDRALREVGRTVPDWSGGTRIGDALHTFNYQWSRRVLNHGALTIVISDGWDRGDPNVLRSEIARLHRNTRRLIWLNPLLGAADYEPLTRGIQTAMPYIDDFLPVHNLDSLEELARHLEGVGGGSRALHRASS